MNAHYTNMKAQIDFITLGRFEKVNSESASIEILLRKEQKTKYHHGKKNILLTTSQLV